MSNNAKKLMAGMNELDDRFLEEAESAIPAKKLPWKKITAIAASLVLALGIAAVPLFQHAGPNNELGDVLYVRTYTVWDAKTGTFLRVTEEIVDTLGQEAEIGKTDPSTTNENIGGNGEIASTEPAIKPAIDLYTQYYAPGSEPPSMLYPFMTGNYESYRYLGRYRHEDLVGEKLDNVTMKGAKEVDATVHAIRGIAPEAAVLVRYDGLESYNEEYYLFINDAVRFDTFAALMDAYSMKTEVYWGFSLASYDVATKTTTLSEMYDHTALKAMVYALEGTACTAEEFEKNCQSKKSMGIDLYHANLSGIGKQGLQIFEEGYLVTNLGGVMHFFEIGEAAAREIIDFAKETSVKDVTFYDTERDIVSDEPIVPGGTPVETTSELSEYIPSETMSSPAYNPNAIEKTTAALFTEETRELTTLPYDPNRSSEAKTPTPFDSTLLETEIAHETVAIPD